MGRMILNGTVYGAGSKVEANPDETATDELKKIDIDGTIYDISKSYLIQNAQLYSTEEKTIGVWTDNKPIYEKTFYKEFNGISRDTFYDVADCTSMGIENLVELSYSCRYVYPSDNIDINVAYDDNMVDAIWQRDLKKIQAKQTMTSSNLSLKYWRFWVTIRYTKTNDTAGSGGYQAWGFSPIIYSTEEREVGVWIDNKPLYQRTYPISSTVINNDGGADITSYVDNFSEMENIIDCLANNITNINAGISGVRVWLGYTNRNKLKAYCGEQTTANYITIWYTKTTDVAGSGSYNTLGVPNEHYSTDEQVIGTWIDGKPLYQKTIELNNIIVGYNNEFHTQIAHNVSDFKECHYLSMGCPRLGISSGDVLFSSNSSIIATFRVDDTYIYATGGNNYFGASSDRYWYFTIQYTKTTD